MQIIARKELEPILAELGLTETKEIRNICDVMTKLEEYCGQRRALFYKEESEIQDAKGQATISLKLRLEEQKQLNVLLEEKKVELSKFQAKKANPLDAQLGEVRNLLKEFGSSAEENINYFEEIEKQICEISEQKEAIVSKVLDKQTTAELNNKLGTIQQTYSIKLKQFIKLLYDFINLSAKKNEALTLTSKANPLEEIIANTE